MVSLGHSEWMAFEFGIAESDFTISIPLPLLEHKRLLCIFVGLILCSGTVKRI